LVTLARRKCDYQYQQETDAKKFFHVVSHASKFNLRQARQPVRLTEENNRRKPFLCST
jgi:hypothetical protein